MDTKSYPLQSSENGNTRKKQRGLRIALITISAISAVLVGGWGFTSVMLSRNQKSLSEATQRYTQAEASIDALQERLDQTEKDLSSQKEQTQSRESQVSDLESRASAAESQNSELNGKLDQLQKEFNALKAMKERKNPPAVSIPSVESGQKIVALTFDDGPGGATTERLLDELKARNMKATFFVVGNRVNKYPNALKRMVEEGHEVANHSYSHPNLTKLSKQACIENMQKSEKLITEITGVGIRLMRPPGGNYNATVKEYASEYGLRIINWTVDTRDWQSKNKEKIVSTAFQSGKYGIRDGAIVLMHDIYSTTIDAAVEIMDELQKQNYVTVTVSQLLEMRYSGGKAGEVYR